LGGFLKKIIKYYLSILLAILCFLSGCASNDGECKKHIDKDNNGVCDSCYSSVFVYFDFYNINDLHGKFADTDDNAGVDELTTYLKNARENDENAIFLSSGDMWQGSPESNLTSGFIITDWMNELDFAAMSVGNHEYDWGGKAIADNEAQAEFPLLAINIFDRKTNKRVDYCEASTMVEADGLQIGIIGAIGDCYSSIAVDKCEDVYFKVKNDLTELVKKESEELRKNGADFVVYLLHDGTGQSYGSVANDVSSSQIASYYDISLSDGYVDLVFEGHTHQGYILKDQHGVYHLQNRGDNKGGISHVEVAINTANDNHKVRVAEHISVSKYDDYDDDPVVQKLLEKYDSQIGEATKVLGYNSRYRRGEELCQVIADLYYQTGIKEWGNKYDIVLGGGFMSVRSPYNLPAGDVTYGDIQSIFPFDNQLTLCSVSGRNLREKFFGANNSRYYIGFGDYGEEVRSNIDPNGTYYIVVDTYTAFYKPNGLTVVEEYKTDVFGRDLLAEYIRNGGLS
jgi:2',3'-cyclic-nucleotide 2'-phosphodiesterase/3'-nucleotidase